jgi:hypothetical protein
MAITDSAIGQALVNLFPPNKRSAPKVEDIPDTGCPTPPEGWEDLEPVEEA